MPVKNGTLGTDGAGGGSDMSIGVFPMAVVDREYSWIAFIAIHTAIAHVLHLSGAGQIFDNILDEFFDPDPDAMQVPIKRRGYDDHSLKISLMVLAGNRHQFEADSAYGN
jgi:hypothetical protein